MLDDGMLDDGTLGDGSFGECRERSGRADYRARRYCAGVSQYVLPAVGSDLIQRSLCFRRHFQAWWRGRRAGVCHFRSIFEGYPIARRKQDFCDKLVFEVNGLPSIELKYHYPGLADDQELLGKLTAQEQVCLEAADLIVTVSDVTAQHLGRRGIRAGKIEVIPNGVHVDLFHYRRPRPWHEREISLLYSGTLTSWQGVTLALEALALYRRDHPARLTLVGTARARQRRRLEKRCWDLGVEDYVSIRDPVSQAELVDLHHQADVVLAPLGANDRNLVQGCCPLKILEAMACGTPLVTSDLPVVRALVRPGADALVVRAGSAKAIKDALLRMRHDPHLGPQLSASARRRAKSNFSWEIAQRRLIDAYRKMTTGP